MHQSGPCEEPYSKLTKIILGGGGGEGWGRMNYSVIFVANKYYWLCLNNFTVKIEVVPKF